MICPGGPGGPGRPTPSRPGSPYCISTSNHLHQCHHQDLTFFGTSEEILTLSPLNPRSPLGPCGNPPPQIFSQFPALIAHYTNHNACPNDV